MTEEQLEEAKWLKDRIKKLESVLYYLGNGKIVYPGTPDTLKFVHVDSDRNEHDYGPEVIELLQEGFIELVHAKISVLNHEFKNL